MVKTDDDEVNECARELRSNTRYLDGKLHPRKMDEYEVVRVRGCTDKRSMKNKMLRLESDRSITNKSVKVIFAVVSKEDLTDDCKRALRKLPDAIEQDLGCRQIRDMRDDRTQAEDFLVIKVNSEKQCRKWNLENKVLRAADLKSL